MLVKENKCPDTSQMQFFWSEHYKIYNTNKPKKLIRKRKLKLFSKEAAVTCVAKTREILVIFVVWKYSWFCLCSGKIRSALIFVLIHMDTGCLGWCWFFFFLKWFMLHRTPRLSWCCQLRMSGNFASFHWS